MKEAEYKTLLLEGSDGLDIKRLLSYSNKDSVINSIKKDEDHKKHLQYNLKLIEDSYQAMQYMLKGFVADSVDVEDFIKIIKIEINPIAEDFYYGLYSREIIYHYNFFYNDVLHHTEFYIGNSEYEIRENWIAVGARAKKKYQSEIEVKLLDKSLVKEIKEQYDSVSISYPKGDHFWKVEDYYITHDSINNKIFYDSLDNIVGLLRLKSGKKIYSCEYYDNGQQRGPLFDNDISPNYPDTIKYYYRDGRVRSTNIYRDGVNVLEINYREDGTIKYFDILDTTIIPSLANTLKDL